MKFVNTELLKSAGATHKRVSEYFRIFMKKESFRIEAMGY